MGFLYILCEGERDELFFDLLCERISGRTFERPADYRLRRGSNWKTALATARLLLNRMSHWTGPQDVSVVIAIDNDRAPGHPGATPLPRPLVGVDRKKSPRYPELQQIAAAALGPNREKWPVNLAVAVPVEMIESWVLLLSDPNREPLPIFSRSSQSLARAYYGGKVPGQLKDICEDEARSAGVTPDEYFWAAAERDLPKACSESPSLRLFVDEVKGWNT